MIRIFTALLFCASLNAAAQVDDASKAGANSASATIAFNTGGLVLGLGYEHIIKDSFGVGANLRWYNKEDGPKNPANGLFIVGASASHHFYKKNWDLSFAPSFNIINIDSYTAARKDSTTFGPGISIGLLCQVAPNIGVGFDWSNYWAWFDKDYAGKIADDLGVKARLSF